MELGQNMGQLNSDVAEILGFPELKPQIASSLIDAYAGAIGSLFCHSRSTLFLEDIPITQRMAMIAGTSTCHMMVNYSWVIMNVI